MGVREGELEELGETVGVSDSQPVGVLNEIKVD